MWRSLSILALVILALCTWAIVAEEPEPPTLLLVEQGQLESLSQEEAQRLLLQIRERTLGEGMLERGVRLGQVQPQPFKGLPPQAPCLANGEGADDVCQTGEQLSLMRPCLAGEDCEAYDLWTKRLGEPGIRSAEGTAPEASPQLLLDPKN